MVPQLTTSRGAHVAVIGAGWAGLASALRLSAEGVRVTLIEGASTLGGRARRVHTGEVTLDNGQHLLLGAYSRTLAAIRTVTDLDSVALRRAMTLEIPGRFRLHLPALPAPLHLLAGVLFARGVSFAERMHAARMMTTLKTWRFVVSTPTTVDRLLDALRQPPALRTMLWEPICLAALNTPTAKADAQTFVNVLRDGLAASRHASDLILPAKDLSAMFPEPAAREIERHGGQIMTGTRVLAIGRHGEGFELGTTRGTVACTHVVCAADPWRARIVLTALPELTDTCRVLDRLRFEAITTVYLRYPETARLAAPMLGVLDGPAQWLFDRGLLCGQAGWIAGVVSAANGLQGKSRDQIAEDVHRQIARLRGHSEPPLAHFVVTEKRATFECTPGMERPANTTADPRILLAGDFTAGDYPATLEAAVRSGEAAAARLLEVI